MTLALTVADTRPVVLSAWRDVFQGVSTVTLVNVSPPSLLALPGIDLGLLPSRTVYEGYGGRPRIGQSHILSTKGEAGRPPWVVALPPLPASMSMPPEERAYQGFAIIFQAIETFNAGHPGEELRVFGFSLEVPLLSEDRARDEARGVYRAYMAMTDAAN